MLYPLSLHLLFQTCTRLYILCSFYEQICCASDGLIVLFLPSSSLSLYLPFRLSLTLSFSLTHTLSVSLYLFISLSNYLCSSPSLSRIQFLYSSYKYAKECSLSTHTPPRIYTHAIRIPSLTHSHTHIPLLTQMLTRKQTHTHTCICIPSLLSSDKCSWVSSYGNSHDLQKNLE